MRRHRTARGLVALVLLLVGGVSSPAVPAHAEVQATEQIMILMDTSGSMAEADSAGKVKIESAKLGVANLLNTLPGSSRVGMMRYPGSGGACSAPETVQQVKPLSYGNLAGNVATLSAPDGDTPTALALRTAGEQLRQMPGHSTIVLVSDGLANCSEDPCEVAKSLVADGIDVTVNAIGLALDENGTAEMQCIADATGGTYTAIAHAAELGGALAKQASPHLEISLDLPTGPQGIGSSSSLQASATVTNRGSVGARNVRVSLTPQGPGPLGAVLRPVVLLGNLGHGETRTVTWNLPTPGAAGDYTYRAMVSGENAGWVSEADTITYTKGNSGSPLGAGSALAGFEHVLVMGDSFSSGDGAHKTLSDYADQGCRRSTQTYADVLFPGKVTNIACSGAVTDNISELIQDTDDLTQVDHLRNRLGAGEQFDLVVMTIGGNDSRFADIGTQCSLAAMLSGPMRDGGLKIAEAGGLVGALVGGTVAAAGVALPVAGCPADPWSFQYGANQDLVLHLGKDLRASYADIARAFTEYGRPVPPIVVSPYPYLVPADPKLHDRCGSIDLTSTPRQLQDFRDYQRMLNGVIRTAVMQARINQGIPVYFADPAEFAFQPDHTVCGTDSHVVLPSVTNVRPGTHDTPLHPDPQGHRDWGLALARWSSGPDVKLEKVDHWVDTGADGGQVDWWSQEHTMAHQLSVEGSNVVTPGHLSLDLDGLMPGSPMVAVIHSEAQPMGIALADERGHAHLERFVRSSSLPAGRHHLVVTMRLADGRDVTRTSTLWVVHLPNRWQVATLFAGVLLLLVPLIARTVPRTRTRTPDDTRRPDDPGTTVDPGDDTQPGDPADL